MRFVTGLATTSLLVGVEGFVLQGMHDRPCHVGVAGGVGTRCAVGDLPAVGGAALDRQERLGDVSPPGIPFDAAALNRVLGFEYQGVFGFQAVVDRGRTWIEVAHQVEHAISDAGGIDTDVLHVEALGQFLDLGSLVRERMAAPTVLFQNAELGARLQRRGDDHTGGVVAGTAWVIAQPHRTVAVGSGVVWIVVSPQCQVGIAALQIRQGEGAHGAVDEFAAEQLFKLVLVVLQLQLCQVEQVAATGNCIVDGDDLAPLAIRTQRALGDRLVFRPVCSELFPALAIAKAFTTPERVRLVRDRAWR